ncbi:MAG: HEAT repeat domain-containing protein, partial [Bacteroidales bacterium]|nr:HEAT repeat domain-containing protein [Bacteroidales bacterium]
GILLAGLSLIPFFRIIHFSYFLVAILVIWAIFAFRLYFQYQHSLQKSLSKKKTSVSPHDEILKSHTQLIKERFNNSGSNTAVLFKALELVDPLEYEEFIINYVFINNSHNSFFISEINRLNLIVGKPEQEILKQLENTIEIKDQVRLLIKNQLAGPASKISFDEIEALATSVNRANKIKACTLIRYTKNNKCIPLLTKLLRDFDKEIRIESIKSSAYVYNNEIISLLIDNIDNSSYTNYVTSALKKIGKDALEILEQTFYKSEIRIPTLIRIIKLLGYIDKPQSHEILLDGIKHVNWDIQYQSILSLQQSKFKPNATNLLHLHESIAELIGVIAWNIAALYSLEEKGINSMINNALENENETNINKLFLLLSTSYDKESIDNVRENLESGTSEGVGFGIELLDQFIADDLKTILFPVLDDSSKAEKIKQLQNHYPVDKTDDIKALYISMINRDINQLNQWTKACALNELKQTDALEINQSLIAQLFNPDQLLNEMAADIISEKSPDVFNECLKRINKKIQEEIRFKFVQKNPMFIPQFKQMLFFNNKFQSQNLKGKSVYRIIKNSSLIFNDEQKRIRLNGNKKLLIIYEGQITLANNQEIFEFNDADIINMFKFTGENIEMEIKDNTKYFEINSNCLSKLLYEDYELLQLFINA